MSSRPAPGRRPDSLFDNRYRYDYIYPRGRSGETLRAYDTLNGDQPVVIKRPALQDAPPMRAGQEQNILTERRALERLAGHPVLTELRHVGTFRVGGQTHHYIAIDMAQGETVENLVLGLAARRERLPELESLVIFDKLLDLLQTAHDRKIIYNDVDAKHLFWDRSLYRLKVIDWGNAIFLDADIAPAHASRAADILQTGQLIYFVVSGGRRLEAGRSDPASDLGDEVPHGLKLIINRAVNPEAAQRYSDIVSLRQDLAELRRSLEKERDAVLERVRTLSATATSQEQLEELRNNLYETLHNDPGYPPAHALLNDIEARLKQLTIQGDLDAVRIYITSGNMARASNVLDELMTRMGDGAQPLLTYLLDVCAQLQAHPLMPLSAGLLSALDALFQGDAQAAGRLLVTTYESRPQARLQQALLAERLTLHIQGIVLLRPHLVRLENQLAELPDSEELLATIRTLSAQLDAPVLRGIQPLLNVYRRAADMLVAVEEELKKLAGDDPDSPFAAAARARQAADDIVDLLEVVAQNVLTDPSRAGNALRQATAIDPINPAFDALSNTLNAFHAELDKLHDFIPAADGGNIMAFLHDSEARLKPYIGDITDPGFQTMIGGIDATIEAWTHVVDSIAMGGRRPALNACQQAADTIHAMSQATERWFKEYQHRVEETPRIESLSPNLAFGRAMAEGWEAWDRGRGGEAQGMGDRALSAALIDGEKRAARRLIDLSEAMSSWLANDGALSPERTDQTELKVAALLLPEEEAIQRKFAEQMPSTQIYLKAMTRGIVEPMREASAAAPRAIFFQYVLRGMLALHEEKPDEATFWKEAAGKALNNARLHPAYQALDTALTRRQLVLDAVSAMNNVKQIADLHEARLAVHAPLAAAQLEAAEQAMRSIDDALRRWTDGEFRTARQLLDNAIERITLAESAMGKDLGPFKTWLQDLSASADVLQQARRVIEQAALVPPDDPEPAVSEAHQKLVDITRRDLGEAYVAQLRQWRDTYNSIRDLYLDPNLDKHDKLRVFDSHFASVFIDKQPALPIFRHWQDVVHTLPDPVPMAPPRDYLAEDEPDFVTGPAPYAYPSQTVEMSDGVAEPPPTDVQGADRRASPSMLMIGGGMLILVLLGGAFLLLQGRGNPPSVPLTLSLSGTGTANAVMLASLEPTNTLEPPTLTPTPTHTPPPTDTPIPATPTLPPTITRVVPTPTVPSPTPSNTPVTPTATLNGSPTVPPTLPSGLLFPGTPVPTGGTYQPPTILPNAATGDYDVLKSLEALPNDKIRWDKDVFGPADNGWQLGTSAFKANGAPIIVRLGPDVMTELFGADAARHVSRLEATMELMSYQDSLLPTGQVYFGIGLESLQGQRALAQAMLVQKTVLSLGISQNSRFQQVTTVPVTTVKLNISIERNDDNTLSLFVDGQSLGKTNAVYKANTPVTIYLYTSAGGVVVNVRSLKIHLE